MLLTRQGISLDDLDFPPWEAGWRLVSPSLHVAMQMGLYLHSRDVNVWRVVSEDSDQDDRSFLLIVRTVWIVTEQSRALNEYQRILGVSSI